MSEPVWNKFLSERDKQVFAAAGYATRQGFGHRPAILVVDVNYAFCGDRPEPILESIKRWRTPAVPRLGRRQGDQNGCSRAARARGLPVIYSTGTRPRRRLGPRIVELEEQPRRRASRTQGSAQDGNTIVPDLAPQPQTS